MELRLSLLLTFEDPDQTTVELHIIKLFMVLNQKKSPTFDPNNLSKLIFKFHYVQASMKTSFDEWN
jgi:hypothetical protein